MLTTVVELFFAGIWTMVWHWGLGIGLIILFLAGAYFSPIGKKDFLYLALAVVIALVFEAVGIHDEKVHRDAQGKVITTAVSKTVAKTHTEKAKTRKDRWDSPKF